MQGKHRRAPKKSENILLILYCSVYVEKYDFVGKLDTHTHATSLSVSFLSVKESTYQTRKSFLFHFKSSFRSRENQILEFYIFKFHDVIKCLSIK